MGRAVRRLFKETPMKKTLLVAIPVLLLTFGLGVIAAQRPGSAPDLASVPAAFQFRHACHQDDADKTLAQSHVPEHMAKTLELTGTQLAEVNRISEEACAAIAQSHERMMNVLTAEQQAKVRELHGSGHANSIHESLHELMRKLHGSK
jgi:hypothetical protein